MAQHLHGEIQYETDNDGTVHSDICFATDSLKGELRKKEVRAIYHEALDEWLNKSNGSGFFFVGDAGYLYPDSARW